VFECNQNPQDTENLYKRKLIFKMIMASVLVLTLTSTTDYIYFKLKGTSDIKLYEMLGVCGGVLSLARKAVFISGTVIIRLIHCRVNNLNDDKIDDEKEEIELV
jgi:hypothetical protein